MLDVLRTIVQEISGVSDFEEILRLIVHRVRSAMGTGICSVYLYDTKDNSYVLRATVGLNPDSVGKVRLHKDQGLVGLVASRAEPVNLEFADQHPRFAYFPEIGEEKFRSFLGAPIIHQREVLGVLIVQQVDGRKFDAGEEAFLITISAQLAGVIAHARAMGELAKLSASDQLSQHDNQESYAGIASAPGIGIGTVLVIAGAADLKAVPERKSDKPEEELPLFNAALQATRRDMEKLEANFADRLNEGEHALFGVYIGMLDDQTLRREVEERIADGFTAQSAWSQVILEHVGLFRSMDDEYLRERAQDVADLGKRVLAYMQKSQAKPVNFPEKCILVGEELAASHFAEVPVESVVGVVSVKGSSNSHLAILGRAMGIPTIMGAVDMPWTALDGKQAIVDGYQGRFICQPDELILQGYRTQLHAQQQLEANLESLRDEPCVTSDGSSVSLFVNTGLRIDAVLSVDRGAQGVGLYRTEIPFLMQERFPSEEEQRKIYREQLEIFAPRPVTMRTLDIGGDKALPYFPIEEANPFLGWRGIRVTLDHPEIFLLQVRAMMRASEGLDNLHIMLPMISNIDELDAAIKLIDQAYSELTEEDGLAIARPRLGVMIEVPAAVYQVRAIAGKVDFLSVGTNDLTQYLLAVDRNNPQVAKLYHSFHPGLIAALKLIADGANEAGKTVSVCGEMAGDPLGAIILIGLGYRVLSMSAASLLRVKSALRQINVEKAQEVLQQAMYLENSEQVRACFEEAFMSPELEQLLRPTQIH